VSIDPVDWGVNGAWVEAAESSDIGGSRRGRRRRSDRAGVCGHGRGETDEEQRRANERTVRWKLGGKKEEI